MATTTFTKITLNGYTSRKGSSAGGSPTHTEILYSTDTSDSSYGVVPSGAFNFVFTPNSENQLFYFLEIEYSDNTKDVSYIGDTSGSSSRSPSDPVNTPSTDYKVVASYTNRGGIQLDFENLPYKIGDADVLGARFKISSEVLSKETPYASIFPDGTKYDRSGLEFPNAYRIGGTYDDDTKTNFAPFHAMYHDHRIVLPWDLRVSGGQDASELVKENSKHYYVAVALTTGAQMTVDDDGQPVKVTPVVPVGTEVFIAELPVEPTPAAITYPKKAPVVVSNDQLDSQYATRRVVVRLS